MLVGFLGAPISGKTTTAALLFASLKESGYVSEFVPEHARLFIARRRYDAVRLGEPVAPLNDLDQRSILYGQYQMEKVFSQDSSRSVIITDATAFLALLYMSPGNRVLGDILPHAKASAKAFDLLFRCYPVQAGDLYDPNRAHSFEQSLALDQQLDDIMSLVGVDRERVVDLVGPTHVRASRAFHEVMEKFIACSSR
jgi:hypothetical protein